MRLLYLCSDLGISPGGTKGASIHLRAITRALSEAGHEVLLQSPKEGPGKEHPAQRLFPACCPPVDRYARSLKRYLEAREFHTGVASEIRALFYNAWLAEPALEALQQNPPDVIIERLSLFGHAGVDLSTALDIPLVLEVNAPLTDEATQFRSLQMTKLARDMEDRVLQHADAVIVVSKVLAQLLGRRGIDPDKIHVIPNGVEMVTFGNTRPRNHCRHALGFQDEFVVGFVGSLKAWHGVDVLLSAFERLYKKRPSARLLIVGTGPQEEQLRHYAVDAGLGDVVRFVGEVEHDRVPELIRAMDVAVAPFHNDADFYFSPIKLFEYMASGTCVVASRIGQISEVIGDGVNGILVEPGNCDDLFEKLHSLSRDTNQCLELGLRGLDTVQKQYTWKHAADATTAVLNSVQEDREHDAVVSRI